MKVLRVRLSQLLGVSAIAVLVQVDLMLQAEGTTGSVT